MPEPRERVARALSRLQGHPPDIRFESKPMWESFLPEADAALEAAGVEPLIALLRQIEADAALGCRWASLAPIQERTTMSRLWMMVGADDDARFSGYSDHLIARRQ